MSIKTKSEKLFESFLQANCLRFTEIEQAETPRPDYLVYVGNAQIIFEVKELSEDKDFGVADPEHPHIRSFSGIVGDHVRRRIELSKRQIQYGAKQGIPSILLIYNDLDAAFQMFGTDHHDFTAAMYGELTISIDKQTRIPSEMFHGRNQLLQKTKTHLLVLLAICLTVAAKWPLSCLKTHLRRYNYPLRTCRLALKLYVFRLMMRYNSKA